MLDGYPREEAQAVAFETEIRPGTCCISYNIDDDEMLRRMLHRAETSGRSDDNESTMKERLKTFHKHAEPVVNYFKAKEKLIQVVGLAAPTGQRETQRSAVLFLVQALSRSLPLSFPPTLSDNSKHHSLLKP